MHCACLCVYVCTSVYMRIHIFKCVKTKNNEYEKMCVRVLVYMGILAYIQMYLFKHTRTHTHTREHTLKETYVNREYIYIYIYLCYIYIYIYSISIYIYIYAYAIYIYIYIYTKNICRDQISL